MVSLNSRLGRDNKEREKRGRSHLSTLPILVERGVIVWNMGAGSFWMSMSMHLILYEMCLDLELYGNEVYYVASALLVIFTRLCGKRVRERVSY